MTPFDPSQCLRLYLIRHGEVEGAEEGRVFGQTDVALSKRGLEQSRQLADRLASARLSAVYSSDLARASQAAEMIAHRNGVKMQLDTAWREVDMGTWEGRNIAELHSQAAVEVEKLFSDPMSFTYPHGESFGGFAIRVQTALDQLLLAHRNGEVALVTHGGVCRTIIGKALEIPMQNWLRLAQDYGALNVIDWYGDNPILRQMNISE
jgi:alpha-ribazole phosphatase